jgi:hypothetical protein
VARRAAQGAQVTVRVGCDGRSTDLLLGIDLPGGQSITAEVDTGSDMLILNEALASTMGIDLQDGNVRAVEAEKHY